MPNDKTFDESCAAAKNSFQVASRNLERGKLFQAIMDLAIGTTYRRWAERMRVLRSQNTLMKEVTNLENEVYEKVSPHNDWINKGYSDRIGDRAVRPRGFGIKKKQYPDGEGVRGAPEGMFIQEQPIYHRMVAGVPIRGVRAGGPVLLDGDGGPAEPDYFGRFMEELNNGAPLVPEPPDDEPEHDG